MFMRVFILLIAVPISFGLIGGVLGGFTGAAICAWADKSMVAGMKFGAIVGAITSIVLAPISLAQTLKGMQGFDVAIASIVITGAAVGVKFLGDFKGCLLGGCGGMLVSATGGILGGFAIGERLGGLIGAILGMVIVPLVIFGTIYLCLLLFSWIMGERQDFKGW